jgi:broad specificity phosphatase PhoE
MPRIILLRHGKTLVTLSGKVNASDLADLAHKYTAAGIVDVPPTKVLNAVRDASFVLCSDLPRSLQSAQALRFAEVHGIEPDLRETVIPHFSKGSIKLSVSVWLIILRVLWLAGFSQNGESYTSAKRRARKATAMLTVLAERHGTVLLVGHSVMNYLIARELRARGWRGPAKPGKRFWDYGVYEYDMPDYVNVTK